MTQTEAAFWNSTAIVAAFSSLGPSSALLELLRGTPASPDCRALDLGCGGGRNTLALRANGYNVEACDLHIAMARQTTRRLDRPMQPAIVASMLALPYKRATFDLVVASGVFHNAYSHQEFEQALAQAVRVLRPEGRLYINTFVRGPTSLERLRLRLSHQQSDLYLTEDNLRLTLLSYVDLKALLLSVGLMVGQYRLYSKTEFSGVRDIYQGWLIKQP